MGLAPVAVEQGLSLALIHGCSAAVLLKDNGDGTYLSCGNWFVQGWIEGEQILLTYGLGSEEGWTAIRQEDKI